MADVNWIDLTGNRRIPILMDLASQMTKVQSGNELVDLFVARMRDAYGPLCYVSVSTCDLRPGEYRIERFLTHEGANLVPPRMFMENNGTPVHRGGLLGRIIATDCPKMARDLHVPSDPVLGDKLAQYRSVMAVPMHCEGRAVDWAIFFDYQPEGATVDRLENSILRTNLVALTIQNMRVSDQLRRANQQIRQEVDRIASIQRALLPARLPEVPGLTLAARYETYDTAGGDMYDIEALRRPPMVPVIDPLGPWGVLIADASGHGPSAAVVMAMLHSILHTYSGDPSQPAQVLSFVNHHLARKRIESSFVTAFLAAYDPLTQTLTFSCAGHPPPLVKEFSPGGTVRRLDAAAHVPLGILDDVSFEQATVQLSPGQTLLLYTDGVTEAVAPDGRMFGLEGIERALAECVGDADCTVSTLHNSLRNHEAGTPPRDDQTLLAMQVQRPTPALWGLRR